MGTTYRNQQGTADFHQTSAAAAIITGILVGLQSTRQAASKEPLTHNEIRNLLRDPSNGIALVPGVGNLPHAGKLVKAALALP